MGGAYRHPGNTSPTTEWNIHCDPDARKIAFTAWGESALAHGHSRPVALGLNVTERAKVVPDHIVALAKAAGSPPGRLDRPRHDVIRHDLRQLGDVEAERDRSGMAVGERRLAPRREGDFRCVRVAVDVPLGRR